MTVSYGTFSCTLDGFDDPFTTMKVVAEYFRKLAANDRYFGGEPLQPDANKLHQIARAVNPNKVDAVISENSVILRQADVIDMPARAAVPTTETASAEFASSRTVLAPSAKPSPVKQDDSLVEPAIFTSRRAALEPAEAEPKVSTTELLREVENARSHKATARNMAPVVKPVAITDAPPKTAETKPAPAPAAKGAALKPAARRDQIQHEDEALERLLQTTNSNLNTPAHARRSNAMARLKAAVAATEAERRLRGEATTNRPKLQDFGDEPDTFWERMKSDRPSPQMEVIITRPVIKRSTKTRRRSNVTTLVLGTEQQVEAGNNQPGLSVKKRRVMGR